MKKIFLFCMMALVAMCGLNSCSDDCDHEFIEVDYSKDIVGTWTCLKADFAEALVFKADGTFASVGVANGEYWEYPNATWSLKDNKLSLSSGDYKSNVRLEIIPGYSLALVDEKGNRNVFKYCANDLSDEIVGMWVCHEGLPGVENDMAIVTYSENGKMTMTTQASEFIPGDLVNGVSDYKVVGDLKFQFGPDDALATRVVYTPNGTTLGDIFTHTLYAPTENGLVKVTSTFLRVKQTLDLPGKKYDYIKTFVTNVKGLDKDIEFMGTTFNFAKMDGVMLDKALKTILFNVEFPDANTIKYNCYYNGQSMSMEAPIVVDGNKMTVKMSEKNAAYKDVDLYTFQDQDNTQMHMYMHSTAFVNFFGNMQVTIMEQMGLLDTTDAAAVKAVFDSIDDAVETINVSFVMHSSK